MKYPESKRDLCAWRIKMTHQVQLSLSLVHYLIYLCTSGTTLLRILGLVKHVSPRTAFRTSASREHLKLINRTYAPDDRIASVHQESETSHITRDTVWCVVMMEFPPVSDSPHSLWGYWKIAQPMRDLYHRILTVSRTRMNLATVNGWRSLLDTKFASRQ